MVVGLPHTHADTHIHTMMESGDWLACRLKWIGRDRLWWLSSSSTITAYTVLNQSKQKQYGWVPGPFVTQWVRRTYRWPEDTQIYRMRLFKYRVFTNISVSLINCGNHFQTRLWSRKPIPGPLIPVPAISSPLIPVPLILAPLHHGFLDCFLVHRSLVQQFLVHWFPDLPIHGPLIPGSPIHDPPIPGPQIPGPLVLGSTDQWSTPPSSTDLHGPVITVQPISSPHNSWSSDPCSTNLLFTDHGYSDHHSTNPWSTDPVSPISCPLISGLVIIVQPIPGSHIIPGPLLFSLPIPGPHILGLLISGPSLGT